MSVLVGKQITKTYHVGDTVIEALKAIDITIEGGEYIAITGRSGAGKSTLLYQLSLLDAPSSGSILFEDRDITDMNEREKTNLRLTAFGYVFQDYALIPELTALENVKIPLLMRGAGGDYNARAIELLEAVDLGDRVHNRPGQLSGGQQQRVAIARALVMQPTVLFADEPTANLDSETGEAIMNLFDKLHNQGQTIVMVTHEDIYAQRATRKIELSDGSILYDGKA